MSLPPVKFFFKSLSQLIPAYGKINQTILEVAHDNKINLEGACEGSCACSTCHVILSKELYNKLRTPKDKEYDLLDQAYGLTSTSRLGCQLRVNNKYKDEVIELPRFTRNMAVDGHVLGHH